MAMLVLSTAVALAVVLPGTAAARLNCGYAVTQDNYNQTHLQTGHDLYVYADAAGGNGGVTGTAPVAAGACLDGPAVAGFGGGWVEAGGNPGAVDFYAIGDGDDANTGPVNDASSGYVGVSNYETGTTSPCGPGVPTGTGSNSGGCLLILATPIAAVPLLACGKASGRSWETTARDGCELP